MATFGEHFKAEGAKRLWSVIIWAPVVLCLAGGAYYLYYTKVRAPMLATKERVIDAKDSLTHAGRATIDTTKKTIEAVREKAPEMLEKTKDLAATGADKAKQVGGNVAERWRNWRNPEATTIEVPK